MAAEAWMWLASGLGYGAVNSGEVLSACPGGPDEILENLGGERMDELLTSKQADRLAASRPQDFALRVAHAQTVGVYTVGYGDVRYPSALRNIANPPPVLFIKGDLTLMNGQLSIGMVGARRPSAYGVEAVKTVGRGIALGGAIIVSGLAAGLDAEAHKAALAVNGPTIACIAFGHDHCYPAANRKLMEIIERHGAVVSEYPLGTAPEKPYFLHRNRIIAGISHGLVVVEARRHSGTMSTVNFATDYGRDVFAVPGSIFSELSGGTNTMIREGAYLAGNAGDVLAVYGIELPGEDPVAAAAKQAGEGRPAVAGAAPPWQQILARTSEEEPLREELPGQQTFGEAVRAALPGGAGPAAVSGALETFRQMQSAARSPRAGERDTLLEARAAAVKDAVEILPPGQKPGQSPAAASKKNKGEVAPFPWERIERVNKAQISDLSPANTQENPVGKGRRSLVESRLLPADVAEKQRIQPPSSAPPAAVQAAAVQPAARVGAVQRVEPLAAAEPLQPVLPPPKSAGQPPAPPVVPHPPAEASQEKKPQATGLAGRLRTMQPPAAKADKKERSSAPELSPAAKKPSVSQNPRDSLSPNAKKTLAQLGPKPVALAEVCAKSGLSLAEAMAALTELELAGLSRQLAGRLFVMADV